MDWRSVGKALIKAAVTLAAGYVILRTVPVMQIGSTLTTVPIWVLLGLISVTGLQFVLTSASLQVLIGAGEPVPLTTAVRIDATGGALNTLIPSRAGALITVPALIARRTSLSAADGAMVKAVQFTGIAAWSGIVGGIGLGLVAENLSLAIAAPLAVSASIYLGFLTTSVMAVWWTPTLPGWLPGPLHDLSKGSVSFSRSEFAVALGLLGLSFLAPIVRWALLAPVVDLDVPVWLLVVLPTVAYLPTVLPVSFGGIGVAELSGVAVVTALSGNPAAAGAIVLLDRAVGTYLPLLASGAIATLDLWIFE